MFRAGSTLFVAAIVCIASVIGGCNRSSQDFDEEENAKPGHSHKHAENGHGGHSEKQPPQLALDDERKLFFTPGGLYTQADIDANGPLTASEKFKGLMAKHDAKPRAGDKTCPVSETKANPRFTWIVGGKTYEFCCPPCVADFVALAKEHPEEIQEPEHYRKK